MVYLVVTRVDYAVGLVSNQTLTIVCAVRRMNREVGVRLVRVAVLEVFSRALASVTSRK